MCALLSVHRKIRIRLLKKKMCGLSTGVREERRHDVTFIFEVELSLVTVA